jgi:DNA-binding PadR family transcriptional regulator
MKVGERQSFEFTILVILEYFVRHENLGPVTKYHVMNRVPSLPTQRQDRVSEILDLLVLRGWVSLERQDGGATGYKITPEGKIEYGKWIRQFLSFVRMLRTGHED